MLRIFNRVYFSFKMDSIVNPILIGCIDLFGERKFYQIRCKRLLYVSPIR